MYHAYGIADFFPHTDRFMPEATLPTLPLLFICLPAILLHPREV